MKNYLKTGLTLFLICAVCATLCALVNQITSPVIAENQRKTDLAALQSVSGGMFPGDGESVEDRANINSITPLYKDEAKTELGGYSLNLTGKGYGGAFTIIASYYLDGSLINAKMTNNSETAGLGKKAENSWYMDMFKNLGSKSPIPVSKNDLKEDEVALVSGATITFNGVTSVLRLGSDYIKEVANGISR